MASIFPGRCTAQIDGPFVVFLIGMRVNRLLALRRWTRVAAAMPPMIAELKRNPELGLLHAQFFMYWRGVGVVQYWRSFEHLHAYAHARDAQHLPAWAEFNRRIGGDGSVGIWHETYMVTQGQYECIYVNMPRFGLCGASQHLPITGQLDTARNRIGKAEPVTTGAANIGDPH
jgi:hypothetical protein